MEVAVSYLCWNCGNSITVIEDIDMKLPASNIEQWNVCPDCIIKEKEKCMVIS